MILLVPSIYSADILVIEEAVRMVEEADICAVGSPLFRSKDPHAILSATKELTERMKQA